MTLIFLLNLFVISLTLIVNFVSVWYESIKCEIIIKRTFSGLKISCSVLVQHVMMNQQQTGLKISPKTGSESEMFQSGNLNCRNTRRVQGIEEGPLSVSAVS